MRPGFARFVLPALAVLCAPAHAGSISGRFVEKGSGSPLASVEVVARRIADSTVAAHATAAADGRFRLDRLEPGRYLLRASLLGYLPYLRPDIDVAGAAPDVDLGTLPLAVSPIAIPGVATETARATAIVAPDRNVYLTKDMPAASAGTAIDLLRAVPELDVDIDDKVSLRGSSSVTIQINGRTSPLRGEALTQFLRQFAANRIERVEVIANPSARFDPEGMAGIVNLVTREPLDLGSSGSVYLSAGQRSRSSGGRLAWQQGRLTLSGGLSGYWGKNDSRYDDSRQNLLARPPSAYRLNSATVNRNGFGNGDASFDLALDKRSTLYGSANGSLSEYRSEGRTGYVLSDSAQGVTSSYVRDTEGHNDWRHGSITLGFRRVIEQGRNEWTVELRQSDNDGGNRHDAAQAFTIPADSIGQVSRQEGSNGSRERSLQVDEVHPLGAKGKLEVGYRGLERSEARSSALTIFSGPPGGGLSDYVHREVFHSGYLTLGSTFGRLSLQGGVRAEAAGTTLELIPQGDRYENDYRSVFPSANAAWDFGRGRTLRFTYSKRIERPVAWYLDPEPPALDPLNRWAGNPYLRPKYTHSFSLEASWSGSRGLLRLSPFHRETVNNWDQFKTVDSLGAARTTWLNASSIRFLGGSVMASLRQTGRLGGTMNLSVYRESHDASNLSELARRTATHWSANGNLTLKASSVLDLQGAVRYSPAQTLAQGEISAILYSNLGARLKLSEKAWLNLWLNDPFDLWEYRYVTRDASHVQTSTNHYSIRSAMLSFGWSWGKPPEQKPRRQNEEQPQQEQPVQMH